MSAHLRMGRLWGICGFLFAVLTVRAVSGAPGEGMTVNAMLRRAVPTDQIISGPYTFPALNIADVDKWFARIHQLWESLHNADGSWQINYKDITGSGSTIPRPPFVAEAAIGYMYAFRVFPETTLYKTRAIGGLDWLLGKQLADGSFLDYVTDTTKVDRTDAAIAGSAFLMGYQEFRDAAYLTAATKVANWLKGGGCDPTGCFQPGLTDLPPNPPSFYRPLWFLSRYYEYTGDAAILSAAVNIGKAYAAGLDWNLGTWSDAHSQLNFYHELRTAALVQLLAVMPANHPERATISKAAYATTNHVITRQASSGGITVTIGSTELAHGDNWSFLVWGEGIRISGWALCQDPLNGVIKYEVGLPLTGKDATGGIPIDPPSEKHDLESTMWGAGYMVWYVRQR